jgi:hypothetical protein
MEFSNLEIRLAYLSPPSFYLKLNSPAHLYLFFFRWVLKLIDRAHQEPTKRLIVFLAMKGHIHGVTAMDIVAALPLPIPPILMSNSLSI